MLYTTPYEGKYMKVVLTIAGSDSSGGAGIQADLKTFEAFGVFGTSALTVLTAQNTTGVTDVQEISPKFVQEQIKAVLDDFDVAAIKIGMLYSIDIIEAVESMIKELDIPMVIDPVFISKVGSPLLQDNAVESMKKLFKYATVITPNMHEAEKLFDYIPNNEKSLKTLSQAPCPVLIKHHVVEVSGIKKSVDKLIVKDKQSTFESLMLDTTSLHGTGCSYSSAITANLALGKELDEAIKVSKDFIYQAILKAPKIGNGAGPINHKEGIRC